MDTLQPSGWSGLQNDNVTEYRYALVESDGLDIETQNAIIHQLELPCAALVYSGKKSPACHRARGRAGLCRVPPPGGLPLLCVPEERAGTGPGLPQSQPAVTHAGRHAR